MPVSAREATEPAAPERKVFSTAGLPAARRIERWESHNAAALIGLDVRAAGPLDATEVNVQLPDVRLARVRACAHAVERTPEVISRCPADSVAIYLTLRGDASFASADGTRDLRPGETTSFSAAAGGTASGVPRPLPGTGQYARALARLAGRATGPGPTPPPDEDTVLDLVAVLAAGQGAARATAHRAAARCHIEEHLTNPGLSADQIAAAVGISERQLSRVFAADGTSVPRHILTRRLQLAYSILAAPAPAQGPARGGAGETVAEVAARCGFTSANYFSHAFRQHFGLRAGDLRR
jgi:AraC-like DNA-binding protein